MGSSDICWPWQAARDVDGYGTAWYNGRNVRAHRLFYEITHGSIQPGYLICHTCDNPPCCNPDHLFMGTASDNMRDMANKKRGCPGSHLYPERMPRGEKHPGAHLTDMKVREIRRLRAEFGWTEQAIAVHVGTSKSSVKHVLHNRTWKHIK